MAAESRRSAVRSLLLLLGIIVLLNGALPRCVAELEPGEIIKADALNAAEVAAAEQQPAAAASAKGKTCDAALSRTARAIVDEHFLSVLPAGFELPDSCPFHPAYDLLSPWEAARLAGVESELDAATGTPGKRRLSGGLWQCASCSKRFATEAHLDGHILAQHVDTAPAGFVCLADYCDVLDCFHRSVQVDALTGQVRVTGAIDSDEGRLSLRSKRLRLANQAIGRGSIGTGLAVRAALEAADAGRTALGNLPRAPVVEDPLARRCSPAAMELAKLRCERTLLECFPFHGSAGAGLDAAAAILNARGAQPSPSGEAVYALHERAHAALCAPLHCTADGAYANAALVVEARAEQARTRLYLILAAVLVTGLVLFYCAVGFLRGELGLRPQTQRGAGGNALNNAHNRGRKPNFVERWLGGYIKRSSNKLI